MNVELDITLHANQRLIDASPALYKVAKCGKRFGKTRWAVFALTRAAGLRPGGTFGYIAPTYGQAKRIAWKLFKSLIPPKYVKRIVENELMIEFINGSSIQLLGADNPDSLRGIKFHGVVFDEAAYMDKYIWTSIIYGQLLGSIEEAPGFAWFISSPLNPIEAAGSSKEDWFPEFYQEALRKKQSGDSTWDAFHFTIYDNPTLIREQIDLLKADCTDDEWNVEYLANESAFAGKIYSEFSYEKHVGEFAPTGVFVRSLDWGISHPTVCLFSHIDDSKKTVFIDDEYVRSDQTIEESCNTILKKNSDNCLWTVCDPSMNQRRGTGKTEKMEFDRCGVFCIPGDNNNRGYNITKMFLKKGIIKINPKCKILIRQLKSLQYGDKVNDDATDCIRYLCVRVHDLIFKWKDAPVVEEKPWVIQNTYNLNDSRLFKKAEAVYDRKFMSEVRFY